MSASTVWFMFYSFIVNNMQEVKPRPSTFKTKAFIVLTLTNNKSPSLILTIENVYFMLFYFYYYMRCWVHTRHSQKKKPRERRTEELKRVRTHFMLDVLCAFEYTWKRDRCYLIRASGFPRKTRSINLLTHSCLCAYLRMSLKAIVE